MNPQVAESKRRLRAQVRSALRQMHESERQEASRQICSRIVQHPIWIRAGSILGYAPRTNEVDVFPLLRLALEQGKEVGLPRFVAATGQYAVAQVVALEGDLTSGQFGILEPLSVCPEMDVARLDLWLVPGLGFSPAGWRLGRGRGYFDRLLAGAGGITCGVGFDCQLILDVPVEPHDIRLHYVATPTQWLQCHSRRLEA